MSTLKRYDLGTTAYHALINAQHGRAISQRTPVRIGITCNVDDDRAAKLLEGYWRSVEAVDAVPLLLTPTADISLITQQVRSVDALLLSGGGDVNPLYFGQEPSRHLGGINDARDAWEILLLRTALDHQVPILGICRGMQLLVQVLGGSLYQDLATEHPEAQALIKHSQEAARYVETHTVRTSEGSLLQELFGDQLAVNSYHHQAVAEVGAKLRITATAPDGVIEAVESTEHKSIVGVQWHPECCVLRPDGDTAAMLPLFAWLRDEAHSYAQARTIHQQVLTLDSHCDTPMFLDKVPNFEQRNPHVLVDYHKMVEGGLDVSCMVAYLPQGPLTAEAHEAANAEAHRILAGVQTRLQALKGRNTMAQAYSIDALYANKQLGTRSVMLGIENGYALGESLSEVQRFREAYGVSYMTLCHNGDNRICDSARNSQITHSGVSPWGQQVIHEMNRVGMLVDLSHGARSSFYDAIDISQVPIVCTHSSAYELCQHPRNLTDDQLIALARSGGVAQVTFYEGFLRNEGTATIEDAVQHLLHMVKVAGVEHIGIGTDFDGDGGVTGLAAANELINFTRRLLREHFSPSDLELLWGGNFLRVMRQARQWAAERGYTEPTAPNVV